MANELKAYEIRNVEGLWEDERVKGRGSFGAVYEVKANGVPCIAKRVHDILQGFGRYEAVGSQEKTALRANFRKECVIMSKLRHPNIVQFLGVYYGRREGDLALLMEYLHTDLDRCLTNNPDVPLPIKISILLDVSYGLLYLHTQDPEIIHRDLKAENVLLTTDMRAKLADLGVAKIINLRTCKQSHTISPGATAVMPPEALQASPHYNYKLDVFSFGALTVHVVTQEFPDVHEVPFRDMQEGRVQIARRMSVIQKMSQDHCLYQIAIECLLDDQNERPTTRSLNELLKKLSDQHQRQFQDFLQMHREIRKQEEILSEDTVRLKKLEEEMAESKTHNLREVQLLRVELENKQGEVTQLTKQVEQKASEVIQMENQFRFTRLELEKNINLLKNQGSESASKLASMEEETSRLRTLNQDSANRCEHLESILEEKTSLIEKYQQSSSRVHHKLEEAARVAKQQIEDLQAAAQQEVDKMQRATKTYDVNIARLQGKIECPLCQAPIASSDEVQLHYLTSCSGYDKGHEHRSSQATEHENWQDMAVDYERQLLEMKEQLTSERDELKQNQERLNAYWESQVRRLEQQLQLEEHKTDNLKENFEALDEHCRQLEKALEEEKALVETLNDTNSRMQLQLSEATNPDQLQTIQARMERYRQERDTANKQIEELQEQLEIHKEDNHKMGLELYRATESHANQLAKYEQDANTLASKAQDYEARMRRYRDERNQAQLANKALQEQINTLEAAAEQTPASLTSMESSVFDWGGHRSNSSSSASLASTGGENRKQKSRSRSSGGYQVTDVRTKVGTVAIAIQKPLMPLNPKEKPQVIIKRGEGDFETGTLMFIGTINQKEMAGIQLDLRMPRPQNIGSSSTYNHTDGTCEIDGKMAGIQLDIRMPRPQNTGSSSTYGYTDGTCEIDGKRYFKCPNGYGVYVPISKVYVEADFDSVTV